MQVITTLKKEKRYLYPQTQYA